VHGRLLNGHLLLSDHISESESIGNVITIKYPSNKWSPLLTGHGHQARERFQIMFVSILASIKRPACVILRVLNDAFQRRILIQQSKRAQYEYNSHHTQENAISLVDIFMNI
jgi:hypothetical protein